MEYDNKNRGMLMKNLNKTADNHPDYSGSINVNGTDHWLSGWIKESKKGTKFFSLSIKPKDEQKTKPKAKQVEDDMPHDDVPF